MSPRQEGFFEGAGILHSKHRNFACKVVVILSASIFLMSMFACWEWSEAARRTPDPYNPVVLTLWHNLRGPLRQATGAMIDDFNRTEGKRNGIVLSVMSIAESAVLHEALEMIANDDLGAPNPPDMTTVHPKVAFSLAQKGVLADIGSCFTEKELDAYVPRFLEEGRILDGKLYVFPVAKSTEALFVNRTFFDRFAAETGASFEQLSTVEGLLATAQTYYEWTDAQTPDIPDDGKAFFMFDSLFNFAEIGFAQLGGKFSSDGNLNLASPLFRRIWPAFYESAVKGYAAIYDGYSLDLIRTGEIICYVGSTAGVAFCPATVTHADNASEPVEFDILPYPVFTGGRKVAVQRGSGFCLFRSTPEKEYAAGAFLKWLTEPKRNLHFLEATGYLPVTREALDGLLRNPHPRTVPLVYRRFLDVASAMSKEYDFLIMPISVSGDVLEKQYESRLKKEARISRERYRILRESLEPEEAFQQATENAYERFIGQ